MNILRNIKFFYNWYINNFIAPSLNIVKHKVIKKKLIKNSIFVETGTNEEKIINKLAKYISTFNKVAIINGLFFPIEHDMFIMSSIIKLKT